ncbi:DUF559 domain-containing protein [Methyloglobulus sp.]|uniref:DUF559 domain-containing protein n=1 Tax=Methyloglobulus sp. TaxID=2518622 RepID=UPI003988C01A
MLIRINFDQTQYGSERSIYFAQRGFEVIRFWNNDVSNDIEGVLEKIYLVIQVITGKND